MKIKISNKYWLFKYNMEKNTIKKFTKSNSISELKSNIIGKKINPTDKYEFILIKLSKEPKFNPSDKSTLAKLIAGPIKLTIKMFEITDNGILKPKYEKLLNKKAQLDSDRRNAQFLYLTSEYLEKNKINSADLGKVALLGCQYKLEKRPLAVKSIAQINQIN
jgi:hypothetical protein